MTINGGTVGSDAFLGCPNLYKVTIVSASVQDSAFAGCNKLERVEMRGYTGLSTGAFYYCDNLKEVTLSTETFGIGAWCFANCSSLKKIYNLGLATSTTIGSEFLSGVNLENNTIVADAQAIDGNALVGCNMPEWNLPNVSIGNLYAKGCFGAPEGTTFKCEDGTTYVQPSNTRIWFDDGTCNTVVASQNNTLTRGDLVVAGLMTSEYEWKKQPTRVVVGTNAVTLGDDLFNGCHKLSTVLMMSGNNTICDAVFANCTALKDIDLGYVFNLGSNAFEGCTSLKKAIVPNVESIHADTFKGCTSLSKVELSPNLTSISIRAFKGCTSLSSITIPSAVEYMGIEAFAGSGLVTVNIKGSGALTIGDDSGQFKGCANLTEVTLPSSGCEIPDGCFKNCEKLRTARNLANCTRIGDDAFFGCSSLTNNNLVKCNSIGSRALYCCTGLTTMQLKPESGVGDNAFMGCSNLNLIRNLMWIDSIGDNAFSGVLITNNTIKSSDSGLTSNSLSGCLNESWNLPNIYVAEAEAKNWYGANQGVTLKCKDGTTVSDNQDSLTVIDSTESVLLKGVVNREALANAGYNPDSINSMEFGTGVTSIGNYAFEGCYSLTRVTIGDNVTSIGKFAFNRCESLYNVGKQIGNNVTYIGEGAFSQTKIQDITLPASLENIGIGMFYMCSDLVAIYVDSANPKFKSENGLLLSKDGKTLYQGINSKLAVIPTGVEEIKQMAFAGKPNL